MLTSPRQMIPFLACPGVRICPTLGFVFYIELMRLINALEMHLKYGQSCQKALME